VLPLAFSAATSCVVAAGSGGFFAASFSSQAVNVNVMASAMAAVSFTMGRLPVRCFLIVLFSFVDFG